MRKTIILFCVIIVGGFLNPSDLSSQPVSAKIYEGEHTGYLQSPVPGKDDNTIILWKKPLEKGFAEGIKLTLDGSVLENLGEISDLQGKKVTIMGTFQKFPDGLIFWLKFVDIIDHSILAEEARSADLRLEQLALAVEGYLEINKPHVLLVYKHTTGEEAEEIKFDNKTLFLNIPYGWPQEQLHNLSIDKKKVRVKVGWRKAPSSGEVDGTPEYVADYINITLLAK